MRPAGEPLEGGSRPACNEHFVLLGIADSPAARGEVFAREITLQP